jgi:hypothetical protein
MEAEADRCCILGERLRNNPVRVDVGQPHRMDNAGRAEDRDVVGDPTEERFRANVNSASLNVLCIPWQLHQGLVFLMLCNICQ